MRTHLTALLVLTSAGAFAQPARPKLDDAVALLDAASIKARRSAGDCRTAVYEPLVDLADRLEGQRGAIRVRWLARLNDELSELQSSAAWSQCPDEVLSGLSRASDLLEDVRFDRFADRQRGDDEDNAVARLMPLQVVENDRTTGNQPAVRVGLPQLTLRGLKGQTFQLGVRVRSVHGPWSDFEATPKWSVPADPFTWKNAFTHFLPHANLAARNAADGRFIVRVSVLDGQGRELGFREARFTVALPAAVAVAPMPVPPPPPGALPAVMPMRDCGTGADLGCTMTREGAFPVERAGFMAIIDTLKRERNEGTRARGAAPTVGAAYLTAAQFTAVLDLFAKPELRLDVAGALAPRVVNLQDAQTYSSRFTSPEHRARYAEVLRAVLNPNATPRAWRAEGQMDHTGFTFEAPTREGLNAKCRAWKEADIRLQGFIMRLAIKGGPTRTDMMNTDKACNAVTEAATPLY